MDEIYIYMYVYVCVWKRQSAEAKTDFIVYCSIVLIVWQSVLLTIFEIFFATLTRTHTYIPDRRERDKTSWHNGRFIKNRKEPSASDSKETEKRISSTKAYNHNFPREFQIVFDVLVCSLSTSLYFNFHFTQMFTIIIILAPNRKRMNCYILP